MSLTKQFLRIAVVGIAHLSSHCASVDEGDEAETLRSQEQDPSSLDVQDDGNLVLHGPAKKVHWTANTWSS